MEPASGGQESPMGTITPPVTPMATPRARAAEPPAQVQPPAPRNEQGMNEDTVLTPSRLRLDARVFLIHTTLSWLCGNSTFVVLVLFKLRGATYSWETAFIPLFLSGAATIAVQSYCLFHRQYFIFNQLGPPPLITSSARIHLQYSYMMVVRNRSHAIDCINNIVEAVAVIAAEAALAYGLQSGRLQTGQVALRLLFTPIWVAWPVTSFLSCLKARNERSMGGMRDFFFVFCLFIACEVDGITTWSWSVTFIVPWVWFCGIFLIAFGVLVLLLSSRFWLRLSDHSLPLGFFLLLASTAPQFISYVYLVDLLQALKENNNNLDLNRSIAYICIPNAMSWALMWLSSLVLYHGLRQKELVRDRLMVSNQVWTRNEAVARAVGGGGGEEDERRVDLMSQEEVQRLVDEMMAQRDKPTRLLRIGTSLYKRLVDDASVGGGEGLGAGLSSPSTPPLNQTALTGSGTERDLELGVLNVGSTSSPRQDNGVGQHRIAVTPPLSSPSFSALSPPGHAGILSIEGDMGRGVVGGLGGGGLGGGGGGRLPLMNRSTSRVTPLIDDQVRSSASSLAEVIRAAASASNHRSREATLPATAPAAAAAAVTTAPAVAQSADENLCVICYDAEPTCILLAVPGGSSGPCGHGGFCKRCANLLYVRLPSECPVCRAPIDQVVELEVQPAIGFSSPVKN